MLKTQMIRLKHLQIIGFCLTISGCGGSGEPCINASDTQANDTCSTGVTSSLGENNQQNNSSQNQDLTSLAGNLILDPKYRIDSDTPNSDNELLSNNQITRPQILPNPVSLNGYVSTATDFNDTQDIFQINLTAGDQIQINTQTELEINLKILTLAGQPLDNSEINKQDNKIQMLVPGSFLIQISALTGAGTYQLSVQQSELFTEQSTEAQSIQSSSGSTTATFIEQKKPVTEREKTDEADQIIHSEIIVKFASAQARPLLEKKIYTSNSSDWQLVSQDGAVARFKLQNSDKMDPKDIESAFTETLKMLEIEPGFIEAEPNMKVRLQMQSDDPLTDLQWHLNSIQVPEAWKTSLGSNKVTVAIIDTGILDHPDLGNFVANGYDFISNSTTANDGDGVDSNPLDEGDGRLPDNRHSFHGTHMAGIIGATTNNNLGISGINWAVNIMPLRVLGLNGGTTYDVAQAVKYASGINNDSNELPTTAADIINLSLGASSPSFMLEDALIAARARGIILVAASGNDGKDNIDFPAGFNSVVAVGAVDRNDRLTSYSNRGQVTLVAPGGYVNQDLDFNNEPDGILSTAITDRGDLLERNYAYFEGTSAATAQVTGVFALMKSLYPKLHPDQLDIIIGNGDITKDLGDAGYDESYGQGLIQADLAVNIAQTLNSDQAFLYPDQGAFYIELIELEPSENEPSPPKLTFPVKKEQYLYSFNIPNLKKGSFQLRVGQDLNNNGVICETSSFEVCSQFTNQGLNQNTQNTQNTQNIELSESIQYLDIPMSQ